MLGFCNVAEDYDGFIHTNIDYCLFALQFWILLLSCVLSLAARQFGDYVSVCIQDDDLKANSSTMSNEASGASSSLSNSMGRRAPIRIPRHAVSQLQKLSGTQNSRQPEPIGNDASSQTKLVSLTNLHSIGGSVLAQVDSPDSVSSRPEISSELEMNGHVGLAGEHLQDDMHGRWIENGARSVSGKLHMGPNYTNEHAEMKDFVEGKNQDIASQPDSNGALFNSEVR